MLFNALRLGFLVVPERLAGAFEAARSLVDRHPPTLDQAILAEFITEGHFGHHVRRMRQTYSERMTVLHEAVRKHLGGLLDLTPTAAGMRAVGWLPARVSDKAELHTALNCWAWNSRLSRRSLCNTPINRP